MDGSVNLTKFENDLCTIEETYHMFQIIQVPAMTDFLFSFNYCIPPFVFAQSGLAFGEVTSFSFFILEAEIISENIFKDLDGEVLFSSLQKLVFEVLDFKDLFLPSGFFGSENFPSLNETSLSANWNNIDKNVFLGSEDQITSLRLGLGKGNAIVFLEQGVFQLVNVEILNLNRVGINSVPTFISKLESLKIISLAFNTIEEIKVEDFCTSEFESNISTIDLRFTTVKGFQDDAFVNCINLERLYVARSGEKETFEEFKERTGACIQDGCEVIFT
eukprot:snap_masked-scaffold_1-processed-gene-15.15-mRNA-1 protein AED:1.00 eAED:1.00 QI:0/-1/0/0/-1/1/1/0/274